MNFNKQYSGILLLGIFVIIITISFSLFFVQKPGVGKAYGFQEATLSRYPNFFIDKGEFIPELIVGANAPPEDIISLTDITTGATNAYSGNLIIKYSKLDTEISGITQYNAISVGHPCDNAINNMFLPCDEWSIPAGQALIKLFNNGDKKILVVAGLPQDTRKAARVLKYYSEYKRKEPGEEGIFLESFERCVTGTINNPVLLEECEICGNGNCHMTESCSSCPEDCGYCNNQNIKVNKGGGISSETADRGSSSSVEPTSGSCISNWACTEWELCVNGTQSRTCIDIHNCRTSLNKPAATQECQTCFEDWVCAEWEPEVCPQSGMQTRLCVDWNKCGTTTHRPEVIRNCGFTAEEPTE